VLNIIYPYIKSRWGEELKYSLRSIDKNLKSDFRVIIYGTKAPDWLNLDTVEFILSKKYISPSKIGSTQFNQGIIFQKIIDRTDLDDFVFFNDDIYLIKELNDLSKVYFSSKKPPVVNVFTERNSWNLARYNTIKRLMGQGYEGINYETHLPYKINTKKLKRLQKVLSGEELLATCYYNTYNVKPESHRNKVSVLFYKDEHFSESLKKLNSGDYYWLNHNDNGLGVVKEYLEKTFTRKSKFEC